MSAPIDNPDHEFWSTQPVFQNESECSEASKVGPIDKPKEVNDIPTHPYPIASTFEWCSPNLESEEELNAVYVLLRDNYVEDNDSMFRFKYSPEFLKWALTPPGYYPSWHVGVRRKKDNLLLAFIAGIPLTMKMGVAADKLEETKKKIEEEGAGDTYEAPRRICEINFLCVHKQLRAKRMAPILIKEVTRRVNLENIWQAVYTAGVAIPTPFSIGQYFHRSLNPEKLVAIRFSMMPRQYEKFQNPMAMLKRNYNLPAVPHSKKVQEMTQEDVGVVTKLLNAYLEKFDVSPQFDETEVAHYFLPRDGVVYAYVLKSQSNEVTDFFSFYSLPSTVIGNSKYSELNAAYVYYYAANTISLEQLMNDLLIMANAKGFDVCNLVDIQENSGFLEKLKFLPGDGRLHYYFYNWSYPRVKSNRVGLVML
ncbi:N-myristoyltransferase [Strigomonas culicis]|uniref:Glycylpeptide N-tetradecanoyltransferase n=1 Tax=Strigomonas culicis TaxID=28005 RepID=S9VM76_9TRYP|nr:glycylpeptide N-tetradecanoyltransferase [Strigomonas culicis]EPY31021.1 glycylpeptide N-tetradecanoyltransferase [Strigomonas culicis]EPY34689.1 N-myristoyltransferase [Strigomonas culicis]|eukprot:EPY28226.1 glycylpeptide N-tetradecanoyltransferase [Strigomonas culicis]